MEMEMPALLLWQGFFFLSASNITDKQKRQYDDVVKGTLDLESENLASGLIMIYFCINLCESQNFSEIQFPNL
jgi:hypothetical protein